ncbi:ABC transporter ATP-binding protein [Desulfocurvibacter africanus]|uniref:energy-coupling factor ABC transporter ATP-binding protein n=1 Tax=Desulfocurvibacter africanus TaxID=873 RepID=UPI002FD9E40F
MNESNSSPPPILEAQGLTFAYPGRERLMDGLDFILRPGERIGLVGHNGAGKTTFFLALMGLLKPQAGRVFFNGSEACTENDFAALRRRVGLLFQNADDQLFSPTVLEDVTFGPLNLGQPPAQARETAVRTLGMLNLSGFEERVTHKLSGGEKRLVALACVLAMEPEALLLDEPTSGLDPETRERLIGILRGLPVSYVIISHDLDFLEHTTGLLCAMEHGKIDCSPRMSIHRHAHVHIHGDKPHVHQE